MSEQIGLDMLLYRNAGTYASPTWTLIDNVGDLTGPDSFDAIELPRRKTVAKQFEPGQRDLGFEWDMIKDETDTNFTALRTAYAAKTLVELALANGPIATSGTKYFRCETKLFEFSRNEPIGGANSYHIGAKHCWTANAPSYATVS